MRKLFLAVVCLWTVCGLVDAATAQTVTRIYWTEWNYYSPTQSRIARADADGSNPETVLDGYNQGSGLKDLAIDGQAGKLYWGNPIDSTLERANLDGTDLEVVLTDVHPTGIALDVGGGKIYWADYTYSNPRIRRANLDGTDVQDLVSNSSGCVLEGLCLDLTEGKVYWAERMDQQIWRANLDGSGAQMILQCWAGIGHPRGLALTSSKVYWSSGEGIVRADKDGDNVEVLITGLADDPQLLELDPTGGHLYWVTGSTYGDACLQRMSLDGTDLQTLVTGLYRGYGIALEFAEESAVPEAPPQVTGLGNQPNPFNPGTMIRFELASAQPVRLRVHALDGADLGTLIDRPLAAGGHQVFWNGRDARGRDLPSGVYLYRLEAGSEIQSGQMTLVR